MSPLLVVVGETASGKSALALELAKRLDGELICADSWTVYRGFDVGTAKPNLSERAKVPHHLLDVADPLGGFSAVEFQKRAKQAIADIAGRGKLPIMVGGTGLYVDSVIFDYGFLPAPDPALRTRLNNMSLGDLLLRVRDLDLDASTIDIHNKRRVIRLIENNGQLPSRQELRENTLIVGLSVPHDELKSRIEARVDSMLTAGLEHEVRTLSSKYGWDTEPMKGIGYASWKAYFEGCQDLSATRQGIIKLTMDLAKRQRTWFKRNNSIHWLDYRSKVSTIVDLYTTYLNK